MPQYLNFSPFCYCTCCKHFKWLSQFLKSCVTLLHLNVFAGQSQHCQPLSQSQFIPSEYCIRILRESYACGLKTSISRIKDNFSRLTQKSSQILCVLTKSYQSTLKVSSFRQLRKCSNVFGNICRHFKIFGNVRKSSEIRWKSSDVARTFPEILVMTR